MEHNTDQTIPYMFQTRYAQSDYENPRKSEETRAWMHSHTNSAFFRCSRSILSLTVISVVAVALVSITDVA